MRAATIAIPSTLILALLLTSALLPGVLAPTALAQSATPARPVSFLVYHAAGGPTPDPLATPLAPAPQSERIPFTLFDRATHATNAPENAPTSAPAYFREFQRLVGERDLEPAKAVLRVEGEARGRTLIVRATATPNDADAPAAAVMEAILFEHGVRIDGRPHPYVARFALAPENVTLPGGIAREVALDPTWDVGRMGVVIIVRQGSEVLQTATWTVRSDAAVEQTTRAPLIEHVTATWCSPCPPADDALTLLSEQRGVAGALGASEATVFRAPGMYLYIGLAAGAALGIALVRRHSR